MPKNGMPFSRAQRMAAILPSMPALAEAAGDQHAVDALEQRRGRRRQVLGAHLAQP